MEKDLFSDPLGTVVGRVHPEVPRTFAIDRRERSKLPVL
jgi:hypothetical protein